MPFKLDKVNLTKKFDRRIKINEEMKKDILQLISEWHSQNYIAKVFNISRRSVYWIKNPDKLKEFQSMQRSKKVHLLYYEKDKHNKSIKKLRKYKQELFNKNLI